MNVTHADLKNGVLIVDLNLDIPEELKPRRISL